MKTGGKIADEGFHRRMPETVEAEEIHFIHGLLGGPALEGHAVGGDKNAGAIVAEAAMNENPFLRMVTKDLEELGDLLV